MEASHTSGPSLLLSQRQRRRRCHLARRLNSGCSPHLSLQSIVFKREREKKEKEHLPGGAAALRASRGALHNCHWVGRQITACLRRGWWLNLGGCPATRWAVCARSVARLVRWEMSANSPSHARAHTRARPTYKRSRCRGRNQPLQV